MTIFVAKDITGRKWDVVAVEPGERTVLESGLNFAQAGLAALNLCGAGHALFHTAPGEWKVVRSTITVEVVA